MYVRELPYYYDCLWSAHMRKTQYSHVGLCVQDSGSKDGRETCFVVSSQEQNDNSTMTNNKNEGQHVQMFHYWWFMM
jgi:hypothetical protein